MADVVEPAAAAQEPRNALVARPASIQTVDFHGDQLQAVERDGTVWVPLKRMCECLGVDVDSQRRKLAELPWATTTIIVAHDSTGRNQELFCLDLDSVPMWLATINPGKVAEELRPKIVRYQRECAKVLRDHFMGQARQLMTLCP